MRPDARRNAQNEDPAEKRHWPRAFGDPRTDGFAPDLGRDGRAHPGKAVFAGAIENGLERFGGSQSSSAGSHR